MRLHEVPKIVEIVLNCRLAIVTKSDSAILKKPPGSDSTVWLSRVPPATDSNVTVVVVGNGFVNLIGTLRFDSDLAVRLELRADGQHTLAAPLRRRAAVPL